MVVINNLKNSFPEKSDKEIRIIMKKYYLHLGNILIEALKLQNMNQKELQKRYVYKNLDLLERLNAENRSTLAVFGHYCNWEWIIGLQNITTYKSITVYKPLKNKYFNRFFNNIRSQFNLELITMSQTLRTVTKYNNSGTNYILAMVSDQTPPRGDIQFWTDFLNQDTPFYNGAEKIARKYNMPVVFFKTKRVKKGYYEVDIELMTDSPASLPENEITGMYARILEKQIREAPEYWLWSHKRWKHKRDPME
jgi:KDO2-lipid IV(A) lauroyltransferase